MWALKFRTGQHKRIPGSEFPESTIVPLTALVAHDSRGGAPPGYQFGLWITPKVGLCATACLTTGNRTLPMVRNKR